MAGRRATAPRSTSLTILRRKAEAIDRILRANEAPHRASLALADEVRRHLDALKEIGGADILRLQTALDRMTALASRQSAALKKVAATTASLLANLS